MINLPDKKSSGFAHILLFLVVASVTGAFLVNFTSAIKNPNVKGVSLAREGGESGPSENRGPESQKVDFNQGRPEFKKEGSTPPQGNVFIQNNNDKKGKEDKPTTLPLKQEIKKIVLPKGGSASVEIIKDISKLKSTDKDTLYIKLEKESENVSPEFEQEIKDELESLKRELDKEFGIKVSTNSGNLELETPKFKAQTKLPLSINHGTKQLVASTSAGLRVINTLPDQALQNALGAGILAKNNLAELSENNGELVYKIDGTKNLKIFGFIPVNIPIKVNVSAETGSVVAENQSFITGLLSNLSF